ASYRPPTCRLPCAEPRAVNLNRSSCFWAMRRSFAGSAAHGIIHCPQLAPVIDGGQRRCQRERRAQEGEAQEAFSLSWPRVAVLQPCCPYNSAKCFKSVTLSTLSRTDS